MSKRVLLVIIAVALLSIAGGVTYITKQQAEVKAELQKQNEHLDAVKKAQQEDLELSEARKKAALERFSPAARKAIEAQQRKQKNSGN